MPNLFRIEKFTGWHMLAVLVMFFGVIVSVNLTLAWKANSSWTGLVVKNSYVASQNFNEQTAERRRQQAMGWKAGIGYETGRVTITLADAEGTAIKAASLTAMIGRPAFEAQDRTVVFNKTGSGVYAAETELGTGIWQADIDAVDAEGRRWQHSIRFTVEAGK